MPGIRNIALLILSMLASGCATIHRPVTDATAAERLRHEIVALHSQIKDDLQVLTYAALERCQNPTTRACLSTVLSIIGQPDPMEKAYALTLGDSDLEAICSRSMAAQAKLDRSRAQLVKIQDKTTRHLEVASADHHFMAKVRAGARWAMIILVIVTIMKKL